VIIKISKGRLVSTHIHTHGIPVCSIRIAFKLTSFESYSFYIEKDI